MEEYLDIEEANRGYQQQDGKIPVFLKVLCILTFVGAGMGILGSVYNILMNDFTIRSLEMQQNNPFGVFADYGQYIETLKKWGVVAGCLNLLASALCLVGALMMWKLKKTGFFIYVAGQIIPFVVLYGLMGGAPAMGGPFAGFAMLGQVLGIIFPLAFVVMYSVNFKHLK